MTLVHRSVANLLVSISAPVMILATACGSGSDGTALDAAETPIAATAASISTAVPPDGAGAPVGAGGLTAIEVLQRAAEASASLGSFRFTTETVVTAGDEAQVATVNGEWSKPGRYRGVSDVPDDPIAEFIVADGQLIYRERGTDVWRQEATFDPLSGIGSGQIIPRMETFEFSDPAEPDDGDLYRITGSERIQLAGVSDPIIQVHQIAVRVSDFHVEYVISAISPDPDIGLEGTRRAFVVFDRNQPGPIEIPATVLPPGS